MVAVKDPTFIYMHQLYAYLPDEKWDSLWKDYCLTSSSFLYWASVSFIIEHDCTFTNDGGEKETSLVVAIKKGTFYVM